METPPQRACPHVPEDREDADRRCPPSTPHPHPRHEMPPVQCVRARESCSPPIREKKPPSWKHPTSENRVEHTEGCSQVEERRTSQRLFFYLLLLSSGEGLCFGREEETSEKLRRNANWCLICWCIWNLSIIYIVRFSTGFCFVFFLCPTKVKDDSTWNKMASRFKTIEDQLSTHTHIYTLWCPQKYLERWDICSTFVFFKEPNQSWKQTRWIQTAKH